MKKIYCCFWQAVDTKSCEGVSLFAISDILGTHVRHRVVSTARRRNVISFNVVGVGWAKNVHVQCTLAYVGNATLWHVHVHLHAYGMLHSDKFMCTGVAFGGLIAFMFFCCRPSITNLVFRCGDILMSQQTVTKPLYNHKISYVYKIIWIHACHSFVLFSDQSQQPTKHVWKQISARWHKGMCHLQTHVRLHGFPTKLSAALRTNQTKHTLDPLIPGKNQMRPWFLTPLDIKCPRCCSP